MSGDLSGLSADQLAEKVRPGLNPVYTTVAIAEGARQALSELVRRASERDQAARPFLMTKEGTFTRESVEALAAEAHRLRDALEEAHEHLTQAMLEATHGKTASAAYIDQLVASAANLIRSALAAGGGKAGK